MKATYLLIDLLTVAIPLAFSFHPRIKYYSRWRRALPAMVLTATLFVAWDAYFTSVGTWRFNPRYLTGVYIGNLPVEEWLFFLCIPYACVFTVYCIGGLFNHSSAALQTPAVTWLLIGFLFVIGVWKIDCRYTAYTFLSLALLLICCRLIWKIAWLGRFYVVWAILLLPLLVVDGLLTGTGLAEPVVLYHPQDILGLRIATIPLEDIFYGMELVLLNLLCQEGLKVATATGE
ncbi:MAG TPA: lycopene cyclase domain-containing protein [Puia sp.]|nr:lycopene cyclase domain-containing protein [Puia sp.]